MGESSGPKLLDLMIARGGGGRECLGGGNEERRNGSGSCCDEKKLELKLGLPCEEDWQNKQGVNVIRPCRERKVVESSSLLSLNYSFNGGIGIGIGCGQEQKYHPWSSSYQTGPNNGKVVGQLSVMGKDGSQPCCTRIVSDLQNSEKKPFSSPPNTVMNTAVTNTNISQKRAAPTPVVGWPPIRSFRKNLASSSLAKAGAEQQNVIPNKSVNEKQPAEIPNKGLFVKINMDGVPIGRKVDLSAYRCYENLSSAVDTLFRDLLAAQRDSSAGGIEIKQEEQKPITGLLDGTGEYTLVYEDNEGDRMLVGDVPWHMFVSTVKRLRVLKTSDLPTLCRGGGGSRQGKVVVESATK